VDGASISPNPSSLDSGWANPFAISWFYNNQVTPDGGDAYPCLTSDGQMADSWYEPLLKDTRSQPRLTLSEHSPFCDKQDYCQLLELGGD
jgi:hypothetical protein